MFVACYRFGDASKSGFGATFESPEGIWYRMGIWGKDNEAHLSNFCKLANLVDSLEARGEDRDLTGAEVFVFTDNTTAEGAYYQGTSSNKMLFDLVVWLRRLEMHLGCVLHCDIMGVDSNE